MTETSKDKTTMDEEEAKIVQAADAADEQEPCVTAGELLQSIRQESQQEIECIASALKVSPAQLHALEADDFCADSSLYFSRALAARVCRHLNHDPAEVLAKMPVDTSNSITSIAHTSKRPQITPIPITKRSRASLWMGIIFAALVLAAATMFALPWLQKQLKDAKKTTSEAVINTAKNTKTDTTTPPTEESAQKVEEGVLELSASGKTWIKISTLEPESKTIYEGQLGKGQTHKLTITQYPISLVVGNVKNTKVLHNEQVVDLSKSDKKGVARLELNFEPQPETEPKTKPDNSKVRTTKTK